MSPDLTIADESQPGAETASPAIPPATPELVEQSATVSELPGPEWPAWAPPAPTVDADPHGIQPRAADQTPEQYEASLDTPALAPGDYTIPRMIEGDHPTPQEWQALQGIQSLLWHGDFPKVSGDRLLETMSQEAKRLGDDVSDAAFELQCQQTDATLRGMYGAQRYEELRDQLVSFLSKLGKKTPGGLDELFDAYGHVMATPRVMHELLQHVERLDQRRRR